jgi:ribulose-phosphate 3-epimerase
MPELIPAILAKDADTLRERLKIVEGVARTIQVDCLDGHFVSNRTYYEAKPLDTTLEIELHLMVSDPLAAIGAWKRVPQCVRALWHVEIPTDHRALISTCKSFGMECGLALSPETPLERLEPFADDLDEVLVLGVTPGWSGQAVIPSTIAKARDIKTHWPSLMVGFDGGITRALIPELLKASVDRVCAASAIYADAHPRAAAQSLKKLVEGAA